MTLSKSARDFCLSPTRTSLRITREHGIAVFAAVILAITALVPSDATACGAIQHWMTKYDNAQSDRARRAALAELSGNCQGYVAKQSDQALLPIVTDALARGIAPKAVQRVFENFRCLAAMRDDVAYAAVAQALDMSHCPTSDDLKSWYVAVADYAIIRSRPSKSSRKAGFVRRGAVVKALRRTGDWIEMIDWHGQKGHIYRPLLQDYATYQPPG